MLFSQFFFKSESNTKFSYFKTLPQNVKCSSVSFYFKLNRATQNMCLTAKLSHSPHEENIFLEGFGGFNLCTEVMFLIVRGLWGLRISCVF